MRVPTTSITASTLALCSRQCLSTIMVLCSLGYRYTPQPSRLPVHFSAHRKLSLSQITEEVRLRKFGRSLVDETGRDCDVVLGHLGGGAFR
jgi:hypothetical protein